MLAAAAPDRNRTVRRTALVSALIADRPRIVACVAPAGYGKSVLAADIAAQYPRSIVCAVEKSDTVSFARRLLRMLVEEDRAREQELSPAFLIANPAFCNETAFAAWQNATRPATVVIFENVDALEPDARSLLRACLAAHGERELFLLCARRPIDDVIPARLSPADIVHISERDLRFTLDQTEELFGHDLPRETLQRVDELAAGWPIALEVMRRCYRRGRLDQLLSDPLAPEFRPLYTYVAAEIVDGLDVRQLDALCALSLIGPCSPAAAAAHLADVRLGDVGLDLPLLRADRTSVSLHPLLVTFFKEFHAERRRGIATVASEAVLRRTGNRIEAARIALDGGDPDRAAELLEQGPYHSAEAAQQAAQLASSIDPETLVGYPALWNAAMMYRFFGMTTDEWLAEAMAVWGALPVDAPVESIVGVANNVINVHAIRGEWEVAERFAHDLRERLALAGHADHPLAKMSQTLSEGWIRALRMEPLDLKAFMLEIEPLLSVEYVHALVLADVVARIHARRGDRTSQRRALDEAIVRARRSGVPVVEAICLQEAALADWLSYETDLLAERIAALEALVRAVPALGPGVAFFLDCAKGRGLHAREGSEKPHVRALSWLMAAGIAKSAGERRTLLDQALRAADGCRHPRAMILVRLAMATALPGAVARWEEARQIAASVDTPFYKKLFETGAGAEQIEPFLRQFRFEDAPEDRVVVRVLDGVVEADGKHVRLSPKEFTLLALLGISGAALEGDTICEALWPDSPLESSYASLRVYVNRVRKKLGEPRCIDVRQGRYRAADFVRTDLRRIEIFASSLPSAPSQSELTVALRRYGALLAGPPAFLVDLPAFSSLNAHVNDLLERMEQWLDHARERVRPEDRARIDAALAHALAG